MKEEEEFYLYIEQMIQAYLWHGKLCSALGECRMVLPREGRLYARVDAAYHMLMTGEGVTGDDPVREALGGIAKGEAYLDILHLLLGYSIEKGRACPDAFRLLADGAARAYSRKAGKSPENDNKRSRWDKKKQKAEQWSKEYAALIKMKEGKKKERNRALLVKGLEEDIEVMLIAMQVFTQAMGVVEALARVQGVTHGFIRAQVREMRGRLAAGEDELTICQEFLSGLAMPQIPSCLLACFGRQGEGEVVRPAPVWREEKRKGNWKKGIAVVMTAAVVIVMAVGVISVPEGQKDIKENRLRHALSQAMIATVGEMPGEQNSNQLLAGFMQHMLQQVDDDIDLTVKICDMNTREQTLEVEAMGEYDSVPGGRRCIRVRRRLRF